MVSCLFIFTKFNSQCNGFFQVFFQISIDSVSASLCVQNKWVFFGWAYCFKNRIWRHYSKIACDYGKYRRKTSTANADCCKRYREKNAEEYKINCAFRTKQARLLLKLNKDAYKEHKRKDRKRRRLAKHRKFFVINHSHLDQEPSQTTSFRNSDVTSRAIKNMEKSLP